MGERAELRRQLERAETAKEVADICVVHAILTGAPMWCPTCGKQIHGADRVEVSP